MRIQCSFPPRRAHAFTRPRCSRPAVEAIAVESAAGQARSHHPPRVMPGSRPAPSVADRVVRAADTVTQTTRSPATPDDTPLLDTLAAMTAASTEECDLEPRKLLLADRRPRRDGRTAAVHLANAGTASYVGVTLEDVPGVLVAVAAIVGTARGMSAAGNIARALGFADRRATRRAGRGWCRPVGGARRGPAGGPRSSPGSRWQWTARARPVRRPRCRSPGIREADQAAAAAARAWLLPIRPCRRPSATCPRARSAAAPSPPAPRSETDGRHAPPRSRPGRLPPPHSPGLPTPPRSQGLHGEQLAGRVPGEAALHAGTTDPVPESTGTVRGSASSPSANASTCATEAPAGS